MKLVSNTLALSNAALTLFVCCLSMGSSASGLSYSYIDLEYHTRAYTGVDYSGASVSASVPLSDSLFIVGGYRDLKSDKKVDSESLTTKERYIGIGMNLEMTQNMDLVVEYQQVDAKNEVGRFSSSNEAEHLKVGIRGLLSDSLEIGAYYSTIDEEGTREKEVGATYALRFLVTPKTSVGVVFSKYDHLETTSATIRFMF